MSEGDSVPARLLPFSILREGNLDLDEFAWLRTARGLPMPYFLGRSRDGHMVSNYPIATALLVTPLYVPAALWLERAGLDPDDVRFRLLVQVMERLAAALLASLSVVLVYLAARTLTSGGVALVAALAYAFATSVWSTGSQQLLQHGPAQLSLAGLSLCLLRRDTWRAAFGAALFAALAVAVRPTLALFVAAAGAVIWFERRRRFALFAAVVGLALLALAAYNLRVFGAFSGGYQHGLSTFGWPSPLVLAALWISPNRGLLVYTPIVALALAHPFLARREASRWLDASLLAVIGYSVFYSAFRTWWGGYSFGPRYLTDPLPMLALAAIPAGEGLCRSVAGRALVAALLAWSVAVQVVGVYCDRDSWNSTPLQIERQPERVWDWLDTQIAREIRGGWHGADLLPLIRQSLGEAPPVYLRRLLVPDLRSEIVPAQPVTETRAGERLRLDLQVTHRGGVAWPALPDWGGLDVDVFYRWKPAGAFFATAEARWRPLERGAPAFRANLYPGESVAVDAGIAAPERPGRYRLELAVAQRTTGSTLSPGPIGFAQDVAVQPASP